MPRFKDHFSVADGYDRFRPHYPAALFDDLARRAPARRLAWDCATGSGQAASPLAERFARVLATDASVGQLSRRFGRHGVGYAASLAEAAPIADATIDLLVVSQALHWFSFDAFFAEAERVLVPGGLIAAWTYDIFRLDAEIDRVIDWFHNDAMGPFWPPERSFVDSRYRTIPFPFPRLEAPELELESHWSLHDLLGYLGTWSAVGRYRAARSADPLPEVEARIAPLWPDADEVRRVTWPLTVLLGRKGGDTDG